MATEIQHAEQPPILAKDVRDWVQSWKATGNLKGENLSNNRASEGVRPKFRANCTNPRLATKHSKTQSSSHIISSFSQNSVMQRMETVNPHLQEKRQSESDSNLGQMFNSAGKNIKKKKSCCKYIQKVNRKYVRRIFLKSLPAIIDRKSEQKRGNYVFQKDTIELKCKLLKLKTAK